MRAAVDSRAAVVRLERVERRLEAGPVVDLFEARLPPPPPPAAPVKPTAPPLPFRYMGSVGEGREQKIYLVQGETMHEAMLGMSFAPNYRLDAVQPDELTITYLPLSIQQKLVTGGTR
ncbi:MAG: hypothetical protein IT514_13910 [Burkholderiales bacterium]|nr:hypothetical protein [Burkholderiales bacterium]